MCRRPAPLRSRTSPQFLTARRPFRRLAHQLARRATASPSAPPRSSSARRPANTRRRPDNTPRLAIGRSNTASSVALRFLRSPATASPASATKFLERGNITNSDAEQTSARRLAFLGHAFHATAPPIHSRRKPILPSLYLLNTTRFILHANPGGPFVGGQRRPGQAVTGVSLPRLEPRMVGSRFVAALSHSLSYSSSLPSLAFSWRSCCPRYSPLAKRPAA